MAFIDEAKFFVKGGDGGRGCVSFRREKFVPKGGPDGGDGGKGGDVLLKATKRLRSLFDFKYCSHFLAKNGAHGQGKKKHGRQGEKKIVEVPLGSLVKDAETDELLADLTVEGETFMAAKGGRGGAGNVHFATAANRAPRKATKGTEGEERWLKIELKLLADVGLIGLPNAGKSTLLSKLSAANPKVADYPFTTIEPQLGILNFEFLEPAIIADIPGLIEGAHEGHGLGHKFLRHVERTSILLHLIEAAGLTADPINDFRTLENELRSYKDELMDKERFIVLNKVDLFEDSEQEKALVDELSRESGLEVLTISALTGTGLDPLKEKLADLLDREEE